MITQRLSSKRIRFGMRRSLTYAVGEILLIVVGILLALQIDQWSQARIDAEKELEYLHSIRDDLEADVASLDSALAFNIDKAAKIVALTGLLAETNEPFDGLGDERLVLLMNTISQFSLHQPRAVSFRNMLSAESIGLLQDPSLRTDLTAYYGSDAPGTVTQARAARLSRDFSSYIVLGTVQGGPADLFLDGQAIELPLLAARAEGVRTDPETYARIFELYVITDNLTQMWKAERVVAVGLIDQIIAELSRREL